jgi:hypothetical protein
MFERGRETEKKVNCLTLIAAAIYLVIGASAVYAETPIYASVEASAGIYQPENKVVKDFMRTGGAPMAILKVGWEIHDLFSVRASAGFMREENQGHFITGDPSQIEKYKLMVLPADLTPIFRFHFARDQAMVPYLGAGGDYYYYMQERSDGKDKLSGGKRGYHGLGGMKILLDYFDKEHAAKLDDDYGINNTYLDFEAKYSVVDNWGKKDGYIFSGWTFSGGLLFEF